MLTNFSYYNLINDVYSSLRDYDIKENENGFEINLKIPGVKKEDIVLEVQDKKLKLEIKNDEYSFYNNKYILSDKLDVDNIKSKLLNGILTINLPKIITEKKVIKIE